MSSPCASPPQALRDSPCLRIALAAPGSHPGAAVGGVQERNGSYQALARQLHMDRAAVLLVRGQRAAGMKIAFEPFWKVVALARETAW